MKLYKILLAILLLQVCFKSVSQYKINGFVIDSSSNKPIMGAFISVKYGIDSTIKVFQSGVGGIIAIKSNRIMPISIEISHIGYKTCVLSDLKFISEAMNLGNIYLQLESLNLKEVSITAKRPQIVQANGLIIYNIEGTNLENIGNGNELLTKIPLITISNAKYLIRGKQATIFIDGVKIEPANMNQLNSLQASEIDNIEIIANPSAKFEASVRAAINIRTIKMKDKGTKILIISALKDKPFSNSLNVRATVKKSNSVFYYGIGRSDNNNILSITNTRKLYFDENNTNMYSDFSRDRYGNISYNGRLGGDIDISNSMKLTGQFYFFTLNGGRKLKYNSSYSENAANKIMSFNQIAHQTDNDNLNRITLIKTLKKSFYSFDFDLNNYKNNYKDDVSAIDNEISQKIMTDYSRNVMLLALSSRYQKTLSTNEAVEMGASLKNYSSKTLSEYMDNDSLIFLRGSKFNYKEIIFSSFISYSKKLNTIGFEFGLRYETANINSKDAIFNNNTAVNLPGLYPSLSISKSFNDINEISFSYNRKVTRPGYDEFNTTYVFKTTNFFKRSAGFISPAISNTVDISYKVNNEISVNSSYYTQKNRLSEIPIISSKNLIYQGMTIDRFSYIQLGLMFNKKILKKWTIDSNMEISRSNVYTDYWDVDLSGNNFSWNVNNYLNTENLGSFSVIFRYQSKDYKSIGIYNNTSSTNLSWNKKYFNNKLNITLLLADIFNKDKFHFLYKSNDIIIDDLYKYQTRYFRAGITYSFGNRNVNYSEKSSVINSDASRVK